MNKSVDPAIIKRLHEITESLFQASLLSVEDVELLPGETIQIAIAKCSGLKTNKIRNAYYELSRMVLALENLNGVHDFKSVYELNATEAK